MLTRVVTRVTEDIDAKSLELVSDGFEELMQHPATLEVPNADPPKRKRGRPRKSDQEKHEIYKGKSDRELSMMESKTPYISTYEGTTKQLRDTINGIDMLAAQIQSDLQAVRASRTLKKKYDYVCELSSTIGSLVSNRISAIKEINNTITNAHKLDMSRSKTVKELTDGANDDKAVMDMYNAFVNAPMGNVNALPPGFNVPAHILNGAGGIPVTQQGFTEDQMYESFVNNPSPEMSAIAMERNPNIKIVVVYNQETQDKYFDVVDVTTGQSVPGIERPSEKLLTHMDINIREGIARNLDANLMYDLVLVGNRRIDEY
jgi:hypothetical protein